MLGIGLVDKPQGISSHDAIYRCRRSLGIRKIGHTGTLDPLATGLLVIAVGEATRFIPYLATEPKSYVGSAALGVTTDSQDSTGAEVSRNLVDTTNLELQASMDRFVGDIEQMPPMFSAVKVGGQRLYKSARLGLEVKRKPRMITVSKFECLSHSGSSFDFEVVCSGGTNVRTLVHDVGQALGCGAHLTALRRTGMGDFNIENAIAPNSISAADLMPVAHALGLPLVALEREQAARARQGNEFELIEGRHPVIAIADENGFMGVARLKIKNVYQPERLLSAA
jgi:tRNA pseudouridine55 synthase